MLDFDWLLSMIRLHCRKPCYHFSALLSRDMVLRARRCWCFDRVFFFNKQKANNQINMNKHQINKGNHHKRFHISEEKSTARTSLTALWGLTNPLSGTIRRFEMECLSLSHGVVLVFVRIWCHDRDLTGRSTGYQQGYKIEWVFEGFCTRIVKPSLSHTLKYWQTRFGFF